MILSILVFEPSLLKGCTCKAPRYLFFFFLVIKNLKVRGMLVLPAEMEAKLKAEKKGGGEALVATYSSNHSTSKWRSFTRPSWLLCTIADFDKKMKKLSLNISNKDSADSFTERTDTYYQKRPQLLALLKELYDSYLSLADRYCQALAKNHYRRNSFPISSFHFDDNDRTDNEENRSEVIDSDAESSLSYQPQFPLAQAGLDADMIVADLVIRTVDCEILLHELGQVEKHCDESSRKIELQQSLLELLESERLILLNENARLGYTMASLMEENKGLSSESLFMKRKVAELARFMLNTRENHRVCVLSRKVEDLQGQINGLEKRNNEYYEQLMKHEEEKKTRAKKSLKDCFKVPEETVIGVGISCDSLGNVSKGDQQEKVDPEVGKKVPKLWNRVKKLDILLRAPTYC